MVIDFKLLGCRVKEFRTINLMSQAELAEQIDMSVPYISLIETGTKHVSLTALVRIANALCVTIDILLNGNQSHKPEEYLLKFTDLMSDCSNEERCFIYEIALATKNNLRKHYRSGASNN